MRCLLFMHISITPRRPSTKHSMMHSHQCFHSLARSLASAKGIFHFFRSASRYRVLEAIRMCISALGRVDAERKGTGKTDDIRSGGSSEGFSSERHYCFELRSALEEVSTLCESTGAQAANNPAFLLRGLAGTGKTHLFCDVAQRRV